MGSDYPPRRGLILLFLSMGIFFLAAALLSLYCWLSFDTWQPYLSQIAGIALMVSIPLTYYVWGYYEQQRGS